MDTIDCIKSRRSIRKFLPNKIPESILWEIIDAANNAPCAGNLQNWRFIVTTDEEKIKLIAKACLDQDWIATAPVVIVVLSNDSSLEREYGKRGAELYSIQNVAAAVENLILAAWNFGIGSTFVGAFTEVKIRKEMRIPDNIKMHAVIPLGYLAEMPRPVSKLNLPDIVDIELWTKEVSESREAKEGLFYPGIGSPRILERAETKIKKHATKLKEKVKKTGAKFKRKQ